MTSGTDTCGSGPLLVDAASAHTDYSKLDKTENALTRGAVN